MLYLGLPPIVVFQRLNSGVLVFALMAIAFFIHAGDLMMRGWSLTSPRSAYGCRRSSTRGGRCAASSQPRAGDLCAVGPVRQWVVEDDFVGGDRPDLAAVGVQMVRDVAPFERMKLRMLNGTHSVLAYLGYLAGHETIADCMADPAFRAFARHLWTAEIIPALTPPDGVDLPAYAAALEARCANPAIRHRCWQIAMDGSQKLPQRILGTLATNLAAGRDSPGLLLASPHG